MKTEMKNKHLKIFILGIIALSLLSIPVFASEITQTGNTILVNSSTYNLSFDNNTATTSYGYAIGLTSKGFNPNTAINDNFIGDYVQVSNGATETVISNRHTASNGLIIENGTQRSQIEFNWSDTIFINWYFYDDYYVGRIRAKNNNDQYNDGIEMLLINNDSNAGDGPDRDNLEIANGTKANTNTTALTGFNFYDIYDQTNDYWVAWHGTKTASDLAIGRIGRQMPSGATDVFSDLTDNEPTGADYYDQLWNLANGFQNYDDLFTITVLYNGTSPDKVEFLYNLYENPATITNSDNAINISFNNTSFIYQVSRSATTKNAIINITGNSLWNNTNEKLYLIVNNITNDSSVWNSTDNITWTLLYNNSMQFNNNYTIFSVNQSKTSSMLYSIGNITPPTDADGDGYFSIATGGIDCNDTNATIRPINNFTNTIINNNIIVCTDLGQYFNATITLNASNLILDGNNVFITSFLLPNATGINVTNFNNITIKNFGLNKYENTAILFKNSINNLIENNSFLDKNTNNAIQLNNVNSTQIINNGMRPALTLINLTNSNKILISNNNISRGTTNGIYLENSFFNNITENSLRNNSIHIYLKNSANNIISNNSMFNSTNNIAYLGSILLDNSTFNIIFNNTINQSFKNGISLGFSSQATRGSPNNTITNNRIFNSGHYSVRINPYSSFINITGNTLFEASIINIKISSHNNNISNNIIKNSAGIGIDIFDGQTSNAKFNIISNNNFSNLTGDVISLSGVGSDNNTIKNNRVENITNSFSFGILINSGGNNNTIYNNFFSNTLNSLDDGLDNKWNTSLTTATNIIGGASIGGNFYSNYTGTDNTGNGIGSTTFTIAGTSGAIDFLPLTNNQVTPTDPILVNVLGIIPLLVIGLFLLSFISMFLLNGGSLDTNDLLKITIIGIIAIVVIWGIVRGVIV